MLTVEIQYSHMCSLVEEMITNTKKAVADLDFELDYKETMVNGDIDKKDFRGCPTLLVNGRDFEGVLKRNQCNPVCRVYSNGIPGPDAIRKFIILNY